MTDSTIKPQVVTYFKQHTDPATFADRGVINNFLIWNRRKVTGAVYTIDYDVEPINISREQLDEIMGVKFMRDVDFWMTKYGAQ